MLRPFILTFVLACGLAAPRAAFSQEPLFAPATTDYTRSGFRGLVFPSPPQQRREWVPVPSALPAEFVQAAAALFKLGLPDPRGLPHHRISIISVERPLYRHERGYNLDGSYGWVLPNRAGGRQFAIGWDGQLHLVRELGPEVRPAALVDETLTILQQAVSKQSDAPLSNLTPLHAAFLLRLGDAERAERVYRRTVRNHDLLWQLIQLSAPWVDALAYQAVVEHSLGEDRLALLRSRLLERLRAALPPRLERLGVARISGDKALIYQPVGLSVLVDSRPAKMLSDLERRLREEEVPGRPDPREPIGLLIQDLQEVDVQPNTLANPGVPDLGWDPRVQRLAKSGSYAVEALLRCYQKDERLTRSLSSWRWGAHSGELVPVSAAAFTALREIVGPELLRRASIGLQSLDEKALRQTFASRVRNLWRAEQKQHPSSWSWNEAGRLKLSVRNLSFRECLRRIYTYSGWEHSVAEEVPDLPVTLELRDVTVRQALRAVQRYMKRKVPRFHINTDTEHWVYYLSSDPGGDP